jgi:hypothetical protein
VRHAVRVAIGLVVKLLIYRVLSLGALVLQGGGRAPAH